MLDRPMLFELHRDTDVSGVSGTGKVAEIVIFSDGQAAIHWIGQHPTTTAHPDIQSIKAVHGHDGQSRIVDTDPGARLSRIAEAHSKNPTAAGMTSGDCNECGWAWPCPTWIWASTGRDPLATWDPSDDEETATLDGEYEPNQPLRDAAARRCETQRQADEGAES